MPTALAGRADALARYAPLIPEFDAFLAALQRPLPMEIRVNTLKAEPHAVRRRLEAHGAVVRPVPWYDAAFVVERLESTGTTLDYFLGHYHPQGSTSMLPPLALAPGPEDVVLDLCAAPGSKSSQLAQLMGNRGLLIANDVGPRRVKALAANLERLGVTNAIVTVYRGQNFPSRLRFTRVLVDAPCTGEGTYRAIAGRYRGATAETIQRMGRQQKLLLLRAFDLLEPGGTLVYSTCTYAPEENEAVIDHLLRERPAVVIPLDLPCPHAPGVTAWDGLSFRDEVRRCARLYPHQVDSWGFFLAKVARHG